MYENAQPWSPDCCPYCERIGLLNILILTQIAARFNKNIPFAPEQYIFFT